MSFQENLALMPAIDHLKGIEIHDETGAVVHHIPAIEGKLGSLKLYYALAQEFSGQLNAQSAQRGLTLFAEHVEDALHNVGKHPNIDLLLRVKNENLHWRIQALIA